jgi:hypothetical protein
LDLGLDFFNRFLIVNCKVYYLASESFHIDFVFWVSTKRYDMMNYGFLLNIIVRKGSTVLKLLAGEDESMMIGRNTFLILELGLDVLDGVRRLNIQRDSLARQGLNEDLHIYYLI